MARQLQKKFIGNNQVDSTKILLEQNQAIRAKDSSGVEQELVKFDGSDKVLLKGQEAALKSQVDAEQSAREAADTALDGRLDIIEGADTVVGSIAKAQKDAQIYADTKIAALVDSAPELLNTLNELAAAIGDDPNFVTTVVNQVASVQANLDTETAARISADSALDARLDIIQGADTVEGSIAKAKKDAQEYTDAAVLVEKTRAELIEGGLQSQIDALSGSSGSSISDLQNEIDATQAGAGLNTDGAYSPVSAASYISGATSLKDADSLLDSAILAVQSELDTTQSSVGLEANGTLTISGIYINSTTIKGNLVSLDAGLVDEVNTRISAISAVEASISQEIADRIADVNAEETRAMDVEAGLQAQISQEILDRQSAVSAEETRAMGVESDLQSQITSLSGSSSSALTQEIADRQAADVVLQDNIDQLDGYAQSIRADLDQEVIDRAAAVSAEATARANADTALSGRVSVLESVVWIKEKFAIADNQTSVTLAHTPEANSMSAFVDRLAIHEGSSEDYSISGTTMTFLNELVAPGAEALGSGDTVYVKYQAKV